MSKEKPIKIPFSNMDDNGMFWLQGFGIEKINGQKILKNMYNTTSFLSEATTGFSGLSGGISSMASIDLGQTADDIIAMSSSKMFSFNSVYRRNFILYLWRSFSYYQ